MSPDVLFVYGTLRRGAQSPMTRFVARNTVFVGRASVRGQLYSISHYPGLMPSDDPRDQVVGDVLRLASPTAILKRLDIHEGCGPGARKPAEYRREIVGVMLRRMLNRAGRA